MILTSARKNARRLPRVEGTPFYAVFSFWPERSGGQPRRDDVAGELRGVPARMGRGRRSGLPRGEKLFPSLAFQDRRNFYQATSD